MLFFSGTEQRYSATRVVSLQEREPIDGLNLSKLFLRLVKPSPGSPSVRPGVGIWLKKNPSSLSGPVLLSRPPGFRFILFGERIANLRLSSSRSKFGDEQLPKSWANNECRSLAT